MPHVIVFKFQQGYRKQQKSFLYLLQKYIKDKNDQSSIEPQHCPLNDLKKYARALQFLMPKYGECTMQVTNVAYFYYGATQEL